MNNPATGDRVAWGTHARGVVVDVDATRDDRTCTVVVWRGGRFLNHLTRVPSMLLRSTATLAPPRA